MEKKIYDLHHENLEMLKKLEFYKDEIKVMQTRLEEVAGKNSSKDVMAQIEHFQNQLIIQRNNIDEFRHDVKQDENRLMDNIKHNPTAADHRKTEDHEAERDEVESFEKYFNDLRHELNRFLAQWM